MTGGSRHNDRRRGLPVPLPTGPDPGRTLLDRVHVVLVEPQGPRNIGSVARAMMNFGLSKLVVVGGPPLDHGECLQMASGADEILWNARVCTTFEEAVRPFGLLVGTTARPRHRTATLEPRDAAPSILDHAATMDVGVLFGREVSGLTAAEIGLCQRVVSVKTSQDHASLNLAQAVLLFAYELFAASGARGVAADNKVGRVLSTEWRVRLEDELMRALEKMGTVTSTTKSAYRDSLERVLSAAPIQTRDARVLFALARHAQFIADPADPGSRPPRRPSPRGRSETRDP